MKKQLDEAGISNQDAALRQAAGQAFYNTSPFLLRDLRSRAHVQQLKVDFEAYLDGFSPNVQEILDKFKFRNQIPTLVEADILGDLIEKFLDPSINLSPSPIYDADGSIRLPALDNHAIGTIFEELIRRFNEENNEEAGEHFTPRDVVRLMADLIVLPIADQIDSGTYLLYDGACGTGGMLTVAEERLKQIAEERGKELSIHLFGQEVNPETYAITKADLLLKGQGEEVEYFHLGSTLSQDAFPSREFDFMLSNPPYGKSWKTDLERMGGKGDIKDPRYIIEHAGDPEWKLVTRSSDGQMMSLVNMLSKMKHKTALGSRVAEVHNGSSLFTGDAGQGESNIRRWIMENDWLEAIIALPLNMFYNTGIATYIWVISNRKPEHRRGKVQLIDATQWSRPLRKNLGKKNCELSEEDIRRICEAFLGFQETGQSKIFPNKAFGYYKVTVERPLRLHSQLTLKAIQQLKFASGQSELRSKIYDTLGEDLFNDFPKVKMALEELIDSWNENDDSEEGGRKVISEKIRDKLTDRRTWERDAKLFNAALQLRKELGDGLFTDHNEFRSRLDDVLELHKIKLNSSEKKALLKGISLRMEDAPPVIKKIHKPGTAPDPICGLFEATIQGKPRVVEYEPDPDLRDTEQVPLQEDGGIEAFLRREVLPYAADAWYDPGSVKTGYEISFTRYFYKPKPLRTLEEIRADIVALEKETEGLLEGIIGAER
jgi:type I restriction enzyme M protein